MMSSVVSLGELNKVDQLMRKEINALIGGPCYQKICFIAHGSMVVSKLRT
jgi:hypothetical protein